MNSKYELEDTHRKPYLDRRKPDVSFRPKDLGLSVATVAFVGELKTKVDGKFPHKDMGEVLTFVEQILHMQPF